VLEFRQDVPVDMDRAALAEHGILRAQASFGLDNKSSAEIIQRGLGNKARVFFDDSGVYVWKNGWPSARVVDPKGTKSLAELWGDISDVGGSLVEFGINLAGDIAASPSLIGGVPGVALYSAAMSGTAAAASVVRDGVANMFGANPSAQEIGKRALTSASLAAAAGPFQKIVDGIMSLGSTAVRATSKATAIRDTEILIKEMADFAETMGGKKSATELGQMIGGRKVQRSKERVEGVISDVSRGLARDIETLSEKIYSYSGGQRQSIKPLLDEMKAKMAGLEIQFSKSNGMASRATPVQVTTPQRTPSDAPQADNNCHHAGHNTSTDLVV